VPRFAPVAKPAAVRHGGGASPTKEERWARAGDETTASLARTICRDGERMQDVIESSWPRFIDLTLQEAGV
jgi:hypothetical protein